MREVGVPRNWRNGQSNTRQDDNTNREIHGGSPGLTKSEAFDVLRNKRRRIALTCLRAAGQEMSVKELSAAVAAEEYGVDSEQLSSDQYKRVYTGLYQCHLPRMDDLGVIEFDAEANSVRFGEKSASLDSYFGSDHDVTFARIELGAAALITMGILSGVTGIGPIATLSPTALATLTSVALLGLALFQVVSTTTTRG